MKRIIAAVFASLLTLALMAQGRTFCDKTFISSLGQTLPYKIIYPEDFDPTQSYPVLLFLHGAGERGTDNEKQVVHGGSLLLENETLKQAVVIAPQCPEEDFWVRTLNASPWTEFPLDGAISTSLLAVKELLDCFISLGFADADRLYCTGLSMGGMATIDLAMRYPQLFAAVEPICCGINPDRCLAYKGPTAFRFFHGLKDNAVPPEAAIKACENLKTGGAEAEIILYPGVYHNAWDNAFKDPTFISWMFSHTKDTAR